MDHSSVRHNLHDKGEAEGIGWRLLTQTPLSSFGTELLKPLADITAYLARRLRGGNHIMTDPCVSVFPNIVGLGRIRDIAMQLDDSRQQMSS
jgi:hypothetical protein